MPTCSDIQEQNSIIRSFLVSSTRTPILGFWRVKFLSDLRISNNVIKYILTSNVRCRHTDLKITKPTSNRVHSFLFSVHLPAFASSGWPFHSCFLPLARPPPLLTVLGSKSGGLYTAPALLYVF